MSYSQDHGSNNGFPNTPLDLFEKKNKGIIFRMKRSLSTTNRPLNLKSSSQSNNQPSGNTSKEKKLFQRSSSPSHLSISTTMSTTRSPHTNSYILPSPTHLSYETLTSDSASNLSIHSFPSFNSKRLSNYDSVSSKRLSSTLAAKALQSNKEVIQQVATTEKNTIESQPTTLIAVKPKNKTTDRYSISASKRALRESDENYAPSPAMYWSRLHTFGVTPPLLRAHATVVFEEKMYIFGGSSKTDCSNTLYTFELDTFVWSIPRVFGTPPPPCRAHTLIVNPNNGKIYLFGGGDGQKYYNHLYVLDTYTMAWSRPKTLGEKPSERRAHITVIWNNYLYVFGGGDGSKALNDLYRLDLKSKEWERVITQGPQPSRRGYHTGNLVGNKLVIYGGSDGKECFGGGVHILDLENNVWFPLALDEQVPRLSHTSLSIGSFLFVFAGHDGAKYCNDLLMLNLVNMCWETKKAYGQAPSPRGYHTTVLYDSRVFLFGGYDGSNFSSDMYILDLSSYAYLPQISNFTIDTS